MVSKRGSRGPVPATPCPTPNTTRPRRPTRRNGSAPRRLKTWSVKPLASLREDFDPKNRWWGSHVYD